jgi:ribosomal protein L13E
LTFKTQSANFTAAELKGAGFTLSELQAVGFTAGELIAVGFTATHLREEQLGSQERERERERERLALPANGRTPLAERTKLEIGLNGLNGLNCYRGRSA